MEIMEIVGREIRPFGHVFIVAEIGSNWGPLGAGAKDRALDLVRQAADCGADAVKFQLIGNLYRDPARQAEVDPYRLPPSWLPDLAQAARGHGLAFGVTPLYLEAVDAAEPWVDFFKVASGDVTWTPLLERLARTGKPIVLSTGAATKREITVAAGKLWDCPLALLHCLSAYPAPAAECNLRAIWEGYGLLDPTSGSAFLLPLVGWSDHTCDRAVVLAAVARGASVVECHFGDGPERGHSWRPDDFAALVVEIRKLTAALGDGVKRPMPSEEAERVWARRGPDGLRPAVGGGIREMGDYSAANERQQDDC